MGAYLSFIENVYLPSWVVSFIFTVQNSLIQCLNVLVFKIVDVFYLCMCLRNFCASMIDSTLLFAIFHQLRCVFRMTWKAHESYIYTYPGICTITLTYSSKLVSENGMLTFEYQYTDPDVLFMLTVRHRR